MKKYFLLYTVSFLLSFNLVDGQPKNLIDLYFREIFSGNYPKAKSVVINLKKNWPNSIKTKLIIANYYGAAFETSGGEDKYYYVCKKYIDEVIEKTKDNKEINNDIVFRLISAKSILLKMDVQKKNYLKVAKNMQSVIRCFEYATEHENEDDKMKFISGMYNYYVETAKEDYPVAYPVLIFYPSGDKNKGLRLLKECTTSDDLNISVRSYLQLALIYYKDEKDMNSAEFYFKKLLSVYPDNMIWQTEYIKALKKYNRITELEKRKEIVKTKLENNSFLTEKQKEYFYKKAEIQ